MRLNVWQPSLHSIPSPINNPQLQMQYELALPHFALLVDAEARAMPRNWLLRVLNMKRLMKSLALAGRGGTPQFRKLEEEMERILRIRQCPVRRD